MNRRTLVGRILRFVFLLLAFSALSVFELEKFRVTAPSLWGAYLLLTVVVLIVFRQFLSRKISKPLIQMREIAERFTRADFSERCPASQIEEIDQLGGALNRLATERQDQMATIARQRYELDAIFSSMVEGVIAFDREERVLRLNQAAATLFGLETVESVGRRMQEVLRYSELQNFVTGIFRRQKPQEALLTLYRPEERKLQVRGNLLRDSSGSLIGVLLIFFDVTRLENVERMRKEFVANVSHELRTPITAIKGFTETLLERPQEAEQKKFLGIILRQSERLHSIIEDLLRLSQIQQDQDREHVELTPQSLLGVVGNALQSCELAAREKGIQLTLKTEVDPEVRANASLLEQAVVNLIVNAIQYSELRGSVEVSVVEEGAEWAIRVRDHGCGIPSEHLGKLFERFYRVDKSRSRKLGGTGLGLAIVRHIAQLHDGRVGVESRVGEGSRFSIYLPRITEKK